MQFSTRGTHTTKRNTTCNQRTLAHAIRDLSNLMNISVYSLSTVGYPIFWFDASLSRSRSLSLSLARTAQHEPYSTDHAELLHGRGREQYSIDNVRNAIVRHVISSNHVGNNRSVRVGDRHAVHSLYLASSSSSKTGSVGHTDSNMSFICACDIPFLPSVVVMQLQHDTKSDCGMLECAAGPYGGAKHVSID